MSCNLTQTYLINMATNKPRPFTADELLLILKSANKKNLKEGDKLNRQVLKSLKQRFNKNFTSAEYKKAVKLVPDYNPENMEEAVSVGSRLLLKLKFTGKFGGKI